MDNKILAWIMETYNFKTKEILMSQADVNTQVQLIANVTSDLLEILTAIQADLSGQGVDTTQLDAGVAALQAADDQIKAALNIGGGTGTNTVVTVMNPGSLSSSVSGGAVSTQISAIDSDSTQTLTYTATGLPAGLTMDDTGLVTGTPTTPGSNSVDVTATDATGSSGSASFLWTISA